MWPHRDRVDVGTENQKLLLQDVVNGGLGYESLFICKVKLARLMLDLQVVNLCVDLLSFDRVHSG